MEQAALKLRVVHTMWCVGSRPQRLASLRNPPLTRIAGAASATTLAVESSVGLIAASQ
jgi:hypothetical protein